MTSANSLNMRPLFAGYPFQGKLSQNKSTAYWAFAFVIIILIMATLVVVL